MSCCPAVLCGRREEKEVGVQAKLLTQPIAHVTQRRTYKTPPRPCTCSLHCAAPPGRHLTHLNQPLACSSCHRHHHRHPARPRMACVICQQQLCVHGPWQGARRQHACATCMCQGRRLTRPIARPSHFWSTGRSAGPVGFLLCHRHAAPHRQARRGRQPGHTPSHSR